MKNIFLGITAERGQELIDEIKKAMSDMEAESSLEGVTFKVFFERIYTNTTAKTPEEFYALGINTQRLLQDHVNKMNMANLIGHVIGGHNHDKELKGRKVD